MKPPPTPRLEVRVLSANDLDAVRALLAEAPRGSPYPAALEEVSTRALLSPGAEAVCVGAVFAVGPERGQQIVGLAVYGSFAGASGAGRLHGVFVQPALRRRGIGSALIAAIVAGLRERGDRFVLAEVPDDAALADCRALLVDRGFREESRAADLVRDGIALAMLRLDLRE